MGRRQYKPEQIIQQLREAEIKLTGGQTTGEVCRELGIAEQTYYRLRKEYGGMQVSQAQRLKDLDTAVFPFISRAGALRSESVQHVSTLMGN